MHVIREKHVLAGTLLGKKVRGAVQIGEWAVFAQFLRDAGSLLLSSLWWLSLL